jgi:allophanate hydrolase subunit 2
MVATVISADMDLVARSAPGTKTRFVAVTMEQALEARREMAARDARIWS